MASNTVAGVDVAFVNLKDGGSTLVARGEDVPSGITTEERKRLTDLGVFAKPKIYSPATSSNPRVAELEAQLAAETERREVAEKAAAEAIGRSSLGAPLAPLPAEPAPERPGRRRQAEPSTGPADTAGPVDDAPVAPTSALPAKL